MRYVCAWLHCMLDFDECDPLKYSVALTHLLLLTVLHASQGALWLLGPQREGCYTPHAA